MDNENFKRPLTIDEQIEYLKNDKRVVYNRITEEKAKEILTRFGYINVITPFKYYFSLRDEKTGEEIRDENGKHIYERDIDFSEYFDSYNNERKAYPTIFESISEFEGTFNSVVSYEAIHYYGIKDRSTFENFVNSLLLNLINYPIADRISHMVDSINKFIGYLDEYDSIFILMDRLTLNETATVFRSVDDGLRKVIFRKLLSLNATLGYSRILDFDNMLSDLVRIRNYVYHSNSLTILVRYKKVREKILRKKFEQESIKKLIKKLSL